MKNTRMVYTQVVASVRLTIPSMTNEQLANFLSEKAFSFGYMVDGRLVTVESIDFGAVEASDIWTHE